METLAPFVLSDPLDILMKILDQAQTASALPYTQLVPALATAAQERTMGIIKAPGRQVVAIDADSVLLGMPAIAPDLGVTKLITVHAKNGQHGLPVIQGEVVVFEARTGRRLALLDGPTVTARRTAAMTLLGIEVLRPARPAAALIIGTGVQAEAHADAIASYFGVREFTIAGRSVETAESFCRALQARHPDVRALPVTAASLMHELPETDILVALTTSRVPVIPVGLPAHTLAVGVGAFKPDMAEFPPALLHARPIVVDDLEGAQHEAGDLIQAGVDWSGVTELGAILAGLAPRPDALPVFKTVGQAAWDLAAARVAVASIS